MDRYDERKTGEPDRSADDRSGDVLGLGGAAVPKQPGDPSASHDPEAAARRRERMRESEVEVVESEHGKGATGIDMGAGGSGTGIEPA
jgi:hypothetical protein